MGRSLAHTVGLALGILLGVPLRLFHELITRSGVRVTVVEYDAEDREYGPVHIVVVSNRLAGTVKRRIYARDP